MTTRLTLLIDRDGCTVDLAGPQVLAIRWPDGSTQRAGLAALEGVVVDASAVHLDSRAVAAMADAGVGLTLLSGGRAASQCHAVLGGTGWRRRHAHHLAWHDKALRLRIAQAVVACKLTTQEEALLTLAIPVPAALSEAREACLQAGSLATLRGVEGAAARAYWSAWRLQWAPGWGFNARARRPPPDPVNALLSLGYTMATAIATKACVAAGVDPWLGFVHDPRPNAPALALDVVESARTGVDAWVQALVERLALRPDDFEISVDCGARLRSDARREVYADWFAHAQYDTHVAIGTALTAVLAWLPQEALYEEAKYT